MFCQTGNVTACKSTALEECRLKHRLSHFQFSLLLTHLGQSAQSQTWSVALNWVIQMEFRAPGLGLAPVRGHLDNEQRNGILVRSFVLFLSFSFSRSLYNFAFRINTFSSKKKKKEIKF